METGPEQQTHAELIARFRRSPLGLHGGKVAMVLFAMSVLAAITKTGQERWSWVLIVAICVAVAGPFLARRRPGLQSAAMIFKFVVGALIGLAEPRAAS